MNEVEIEVEMPTWLADELGALAERCETSIDHVAGALFASEVVHTSDGVFLG